jgi:hypothetical protein
MAQSNSRLKRMQSEQPWCVYCGQTTPGTQQDHMPPIAIFDNRQRYGEMVYLACDDCHSGTRRLDHVASFFSRVFPDPSTPALQHEMYKVTEGINNNFPGLLEELRPTPEQLEQARNAPSPFTSEDEPLNISERAHDFLLQFGARAALALHYELCREVLPEGGGVFVDLFTNNVLLKGDSHAALSDFAAMLGLPQTLRLGSKSHEGQFMYWSGAAEGNNMWGHLITFRASFGIQAFVARDIADLAPAMPSPKRNRVFRPGFLKGPSR